MFWPNKVQAVRDWLANRLHILDPMLSRPSWSALAAVDSDQCDWDQYTPFAQLASSLNYALINCSQLGRFAWTKTNLIHWSSSTQKGENLYIVAIRYFANNMKNGSLQFTINRTDFNRISRTYSQLNPQTRILASVCLENSPALQWHKREKTEKVFGHFSLRQIHKFNKQQSTADKAAVWSPTWVAG